MSAEDVELVRQGFAALNSSVDEALPFIHPDFEMTTLPGIAAEPGTYRGHDGVRRWFDEFYEVMDEVRLEPQAIYDGGDGRVLIELTLRARGQASGIDTEQAAFVMSTLRDDKLHRFEFFFSLEEGRAAIGIDPPAS